MIKFKIATPERVMLDTEVDALTLPTQMGEITILPNHIPLVANLQAGEIRYKQKGKENFFAVSSGVLEVRKNHEVVVLADTAEFGEEIDEKRAEEAREWARKVMADQVADKEAFANAAAVLERNLVRLRIAKKHRTHRQSHIEN